MMRWNLDELMFHVVMQLALMLSRESALLLDCTEHSWNRVLGRLDAASECTASCSLTVRSLSLLHWPCMKATEMMLVDGHDAVMGQDFVAIFGPHCCAALVMDDGPTTVEPFL